MKTYMLRTLLRFTLLISVVTSTQASLLTDPDGFSVSMTSSAVSYNLFGPPSFTDNFNPGDGIPVLFAPLVDGTEMEVTFFANYFEIRQFAASAFMPDAFDWLMLFDNIDVPGSIVSVSVDSATNTFPHMLSASSTGDSISIAFEGGSTDTLAIGGADWFARVDVEFSMTEVSAPSVTYFVLFGLSGLLLLKRKFA